MPHVRLAVVSSLLMCLPGTLASQEDPQFHVQVDSAEHEVVLTAGPFDLPSMAGHDHGGHRDMMKEVSWRFEWPVEGTGRGFSLSLRDPAGKKVSQRVLHHLQIINSSRRQLLLPLREKIMAVGRETKNIMLPNTIGMPIAAGSRMKVDIMWHNETPADIGGVMLTLRIKYSPENLLPEPTIVLPITIDVADAAGRPNSFTVPPGRFSAAREFVMPVDGRLLGLSGHMHDWGVGLRLEEVPSGRVLAAITTTRDSAGRITHMPIKLYGIVGDGLKLHALRRYRLVADYDNGSSGPVDGMAHLNGIFSPEDLEDWPASASKAVAYLDEGVYDQPPEEGAAPTPGSAPAPEHQHR